MIENIFPEKKEMELQKKISLQIEENIINQKTLVSYPIPDLKGFLISNKLNKEPIYLYLPEEQYQILNYSLKLKDYISINDDNNKKKLIEDIKNYSDIFFKNFPLSKRIHISYTEEMKKIKPFYSFVLIPDEKFKAKYKFNEYEKNFRKIKENILSFDHKLKRDYSLKILSTIFSDKAAERKTSLLIEKKNSGESAYNSSKKILNINSIKKPYKELLKELFVSRLNDIRENIVEYCLKNSKHLREDSFENFVCFIEFFALLFCGIKTKYYIDELSYLNMDFYADEKNIMNIAESFHYQVQFRIKDIPNVLPLVKKKKNENETIGDKMKLIQKKYETLFLLNQEKVPPLNQERVEYYPTHCDFSRTISPGFRRYDENDDYHICYKCRYIYNSDEAIKLKCSSCFRQIDKERLICLSLSHIMNFNRIKELCEDSKNLNEKIFMDKIIIPNYDGLNARITDKELVLNYSLPFETKEILKIDKTFKDIFGENIGFYFFWISHFIKWLFYLTIISIIMSLLWFFIGDNSNKIFFLILNLIFIALIVLWGNYYYISWEGQESFYNYIWGMNDYDLIQNSLYDFEEYLKLNVEIIMGVKIPIEKRVFYLLINFFLIFFSILLHILMIISNILLIETKSHKFSIKYKILENFLNNIWKYFVPILCYLLREIFSFVAEKWHKWIISHGKQLSKDLKRKIKLQMKMYFEFFNYYFNLYYIAFIKKYFGTCLNDNCHSELGNQLIIIIICDLVSLIISILIPTLYNIRKRKEKEKIKDESYEENNSNKYKYYTRNTFLHKNMKSHYIKAILYYGYLIQFGASAPMTFLIVLLALIINRIILGICLKNIYFAQVFEESTGITKLKKWLKVISFIGIISNLCCIFYTNNYFYWLSNKRKLIYIALTENIVLIIIKLFHYDSLPKWFYFKEKIDFNYLRRYGIRAKKISN